MSTVFEILGIEDKETKISNLFAHYIENYRKFVNLICDLANIAKINDSDPIHVKREYYFKLADYDNKKNYIDVVVMIGDESEPKRVICIENKIFASEGYEQTKRYKKGIESKFPKAVRDYIYITKNNSYINLSSIDFHHIKYMVLAKKMAEENLLSLLPYAKDFYDYYYKREEELFSSFDNKNEKIIDEKQFIDFFIWKIRKNNDLEEVYISDGKSTKGGKRYFRLSKQSWGNKIRIEDREIKLSIHLEGDSKTQALHFETEDYIPYSKLKKELGESFFDQYDRMRNNYRDRFKKASIPNKCDISANATLTVAKFIITETKCNDVIKQIFSIINAVDEILS